MRRALAIGNAIAVLLVLATLGLGAYAGVEGRRTDCPVIRREKAKLEP